MASPTVADPGNHVYAQILTYRGVIATGNPWDVTGGGVKGGSSTTVTVTGVTTTMPNTRVVQAVARDNNSAAAAFSAQTNANLTGITERSDAGTTQGNGGGIGIWDGVKATAGATGNTTANVTNSNNAFLTVALRPPDSVLTIAVPGGTLANDVMIASVTYRPCSGTSGAACTTTITPPAGWTQVNTVTDQTTGGGTGGFGNRLFVYQRVATGAEPASYTWTFGGAIVHNGAAGGIISFSGVDTASPIVAEAGQTTASSTSHAAPGINTGAVTGAMLVSSHSANSSAAWTPPGGMTERVDAASQAVPNDLGDGLEMNHQVFAGSGATGGRTASWTSPPAADTGVTHMLALRPLVLVVTPGDFNAFETSTSAGAVTGRIYTKLAGVNFGFDVVAIQAGAQQNAFSDTVLVDLVTGSTGGLNCPGTPVAIAGTSQNVNLTNGRGTTGAFNTASAYPDVRVRVRYPVASPTVTSCSTDNFTIRPVAFSAPVSSDMTNTGSSGAPNKKAGDAFNLSVSGGAGYTGTPSIDSTKLAAHAGAIQTGAPGGGFSAAVGGTASGSTFTYSEVGNFTIGINGVYDDTFTSVSADQGNGDCTLDFSNSLVGGRYGCYFGNNAASAAIGRFTPDHFDVALNAPVFTPACGSFTYAGQGFSYSTAPIITVTARNSAGLGNAITRNYTGVWQKITAGSLTYPGGTAKGYRAFTGTLDATNAPTNPTITPGGAGSEGTVALSFSLGAPGLFFQRAAEVAPFDADISLALNVIDADGVIYASNPAKFGNEVAGGGMVFSDLNPLTTSDKSMRFGRLQLGTGSGSQLVALSLPVEAQYWNGTAFVTNAADNCTTLSAANVGLGNFIGLASGDTTPSISGAFSSGRKTLTLSPPGGTKLGTVDVVINLNATAGAFSSCAALAPPPAPTAADLVHLRGRWCGPSYDRDAMARARFGVYRGAEEVIFVRENY